MRGFVKAILSVGILCFGGASSTNGATIQRFIGDSIPERVVVESSHILYGSDSLYLGNTLLSRDTDYRFVPAEAYFDLSALSYSSSDTLVVKYTSLPTWLVGWYGRSLPQVGALREKTSLATATSAMAPFNPRGEELTDERITLSGAKSFRFSSRSAGASSFGQSLDLSISGELSPGLAISGSISDRGISPAYGTANSRLNEFDRLNLTLRSSNLTAQVGDVVVSKNHYATSGKSISGAALSLEFPNWRASGTIARPKGRFLSRRFFGRDGFQGPYSVASGSIIRPIVPGSETIWLDGKKLERGNHKDYTVDYPAGRVTFSSARPIDSRSRIEIDYEEQATDYKEELFSFGAGGQTTDSALFVSASIVREGDDREQPLLGDLTSADRSLLEKTGDSLAFREGVTADSNGAYILVVDSLPDSVFSFVGEGKGDYRISFSFVGKGNGAYRFLGNNRYEYTGSGLGEYLPVVVVPAAERLEMFQSTIGWRPFRNGQLLFDIRSSRRDLNLLSTLDDSDNIGLYYSASFRNSLPAGERGGYFSARVRYREAEFFSRSRLDETDFARRYHLPERFVPVSAERLYEASGRFGAGQRLSIAPSVRLIDYAGIFRSGGAGLRAELDLSNQLRVSAEWNGLESNLRNAALSGDGKVNRVEGRIDYTFTRDFILNGSFTRDSRENEYFSLEQGTRFSELRLKATRRGETIRWEYFLEDSLRTEWKRNLERNRLFVGSKRRLGRLDYDASLSYQWFSNRQERENSLLGRGSVRYDDFPSKFSVSTTFTISEEQRNARGIRYLEVKPGEGSFRFENGEFVPDPDGEFIQVEELLSESARVRSGERSFRVSKDFGPVMARFLSDVNEELMANGRRTVWWAIPFLTDSDQPYLFYDRRYNVDLRLLPWSGFHAVNVQLSEELEQRMVAGIDRHRRNRQGRLTFKQVAGRNFLEESAELFESNRDLFFPGSGDIDGFKLALSYRRISGFGEYSTGASVRRASEKTGSRSTIYALSGGSRVRLVNLGELRADIELYRQQLSVSGGVPSFQLSDNRSGKRGGIWSISLNYGIRTSGRFNLTISGRHSNDKSARVTARGEVIATF